MAGLDEQHQAGPQVQISTVAPVVNADAGDVLHRQKGDAVTIHAGIQQAGDVRVVQRR